MSANISIIKNTDLKTGMEVVSPAGGTVSIFGDAQPSHLSPGFVYAETDMGPIYFASHLTSKVLVSDDTESESQAENTDALAAAL